MQPMPVDEAVKRCINVCLGGGDSYMDYTAACAVMRHVYITRFDRMCGVVRGIEKYMSNEEWLRWSTQSVKENCAWALEKYAEKYGALTP